MIQVAPRIQPRSRARLGRILLVLPAYNEEEALAPLVQRMERQMQRSDLDYHVLVVDDGSRDRTRAQACALAGRLPVELLVHERNLGLGASLRDGLLWTVEQAHEEDVVVVMDADNTHPPEVIPAMLRKLDRGCDVVVASRFRQGSRVVGVPRSRRFYSWVAALMFQAVFPIPGVRDYTCGYRAYRAGVLQRAFREYGPSFVDQDGFQCMVDTLLKLSRLGLRFGEVPFTLRYDLKPGATKMKVASTIWDTLLLLVRRRMGR